MGIQVRLQIVRQVVLSPSEFHISQSVVGDKLQLPVMRGISTIFVLVLSTAVAAEGVGRLVEVTKGSSFLAGESYQPNQQEGRAMGRRYQLDGPKEATSNKRYLLPDPEEMDRKFQLKNMNSALLIPIPSVRNSMATKRTIRRSCWFQYYTWCPRKSSSPRRLPREESSGYTQPRISEQAVLQALGLKYVS